MGIFIFIISCDIKRYKNTAILWAFSNQKERAAISLFKTTAFSDFTRSLIFDYFRELGHYVSSNSAHVIKARAVEIFESLAMSFKEK